MEEGAAKSWLIDGLGVPRETMIKLENFVAELSRENLKQNLVSSSSLIHVWARHIVDSAQLLRFQPAASASWLDLGSGAGFPGLIVATLRCSNIVLIEERAKRAAFLAKAAGILGVGDRTRIVASCVERAKLPAFDVISARAFAPLDRLFALADRFATPTTRWILPKGRSAKSELEAARASWQGDFRLEPSLTDPDARIIVAERVRRKDNGTHA